MKFGHLSSEADDLFRTAVGVVDSDRSDEEIRDEIRRAAGGDAKALADASRHARVWDGPDDFLSDRAKRVFDAAVANTAVAGPDPAMAEMFRREKVLHGAPRDEAVRELWLLSNELEVWCRGIRADVEARSQPLGMRETWKLQRQVWKALERLVGPDAEVVPDPILRSLVAAQIISSWVFEAYGLSAAVGRGD
jgi:hypothetical protein